MALDATSAGRTAGFPLTRPVELTCFALCVAQASYLVATLLGGSWLFDATGQLLATDFVNVWAAGRQVLDGAPTAVYDVAIHKNAEVAALGHAFDGEYPWIYPPPFLFVATALALLPYLSAYAVWVVLTFAAYAAVMRGIIGDRIGLVFAFAYPGILSNLVVGQNGFLTAALIGGALLVMERRPVLAGCLIGLLSFKPHLGILIPVVLVASSRWTVIGAATAVTVLIAAASWLAFGGAPWETFVHAVQAASQAALADGRADWAKLQSVFGAVRMLGGGEGLAWTLQGLLMGTVAIALAVLWRSRASFDLKAAALVTGTLLTTPYLFLYDLVSLAIAMAFLLRAGARSGHLPGELAGLGGACLLILAFPVVTAPVGLAAVLLVAALVARRVLAGGLHRPQPQTSANLA